MSYIDLVIASAPNATAYDVDHPTRSTELYSNQMHNIIQDMDDYGTWHLNNSNVDTTHATNVRAYVYGVLEDVFDYASQAIEDHRAEEEISIVKPISTQLALPGGSAYGELTTLMWNVWFEGHKMLWKIWYMWGTEEDPLLLKEKLQQLLIAWPLLDTTIELADDLGQQFKIYPSWKNADL